MSYRAPQGPFTPIAVVRAANRAHWTYWLGQAILALYISRRVSELSEQECLAVLARQSIEQVDEGVTASLIHTIADRLDDERDGKVPVDLALRRTLKRMQDT